MVMANLKSGTKVRICAYAGSTFEPVWSETGRVCKPRMSQLPLPSPDWHIIRFDADGGKLCVHRERLMVCNDQAA